MRFSMRYTEYATKEKRSLRSKVHLICDELDRLHKLVIEKNEKINELKGLGLSFAKPYWMRKDDPNGKPDQLELTHSAKSDYYNQHGTRRQYIGTDLEKIKAALEAIARGEEYERLKVEVSQLNQRINLIERRIDSLELLVKGEQLNFGQ